MIMDILLISECFLIIALIVFSFATLRIIVAVGTIHNIGFFKDIALALLLLGIVGTIAYAAVMRRAK